MSSVIEGLYQTGKVVGKSGEVHELHSAIDRDEGHFLVSLIESNPDIKWTLEIGCAYGLSSLYICTALKDRADAKHVIVDPFQHTQWDGAGIRNLEKAGIDYFELVEEKSEFALPKILKENEGQFDFIFIDGWHTFDHTLLDIFYATGLLRVGGILAVDDVGYPAIKRAVDFFRTFPCYELIGSVGDDFTVSWKKALARAVMRPVKQKTWRRMLSRNVFDKVYAEGHSTMVALKKIAEDERNFNWHDDGF